MKKLSLTRETLKQLSADQTQLAAGILPTPPVRTTFHKAGCKDTFYICWQSELYTACCPTTHTREIACQIA